MINLAAILREIVLDLTPRILGFQDRESKSKTYGCFDRYYWHYRLADLSNARFQEAVLLLALLYKNEFESNKYFQNKYIYEWCLAGINFCRIIQHKDGSFDEVYPNERSFVATSFLLCALAKTLIVLNETKLVEANITMLERSAIWITKNNNFFVSNQMAGAATALCFMYKLTGEEQYKKSADEKIRILLKMQDKSGYFLEYGGWDVGYLSISIAYLAKIILMKINLDTINEVQKALNTAIRFMEKKINYNGTYDYTESSRNTQYIYPSGLVLAKSDTIGNLKRGLHNRSILNPLWMDDRFCMPLTLDYLEAYLGTKLCF